MGSRLLFSANDGDAGQELWTSDGTAQGTVLVKNIFKLYDSSPLSMVVMNGRAYFSANDDEAGRELWASDGTPQGTNLAANVWPELADSGPDFLTVVGGNRLFFAATDPIYGRELWVHNDAGRGAVLVKDMEPGSKGITPQGLMAAGDQLFFVLGDGESWNGLWRTDGTEEGTRYLSMLSSGSLLSALHHGERGKGARYFAGADDSGGPSCGRAMGPWKAPSRWPISSPGPTGSSPRALTRAGAKLFFTAWDPEAGKEDLGPRPLRPGSAPGDLSSGASPSRPRASRECRVLLRLCGG